MKKIIKKIIVKLNIVSIFSIWFYLLRVFKVKENKIVFVNFAGKGYGDNSKYIHKELEKSDVEFDYVWLVKNINDSTIPKNIRKVKMHSIKSFYELVTSKVWISNGHFDQYIRKRKNQIYIQTWHGGLALKKIEYDAEDKLSDYYKKVMINDNKMIDVMISNSSFCTNMYRNAFRYKGNILEIGSPRNDILLKKEKYNIDIKKKLGISMNENILLYAPTFRNSYEKNPYDIDLVSMKNILEEKTGKEWKVLVKLHPIINDAKKYIKNIDHFLDVTNYDDIQELILSCDLLITDYSSTMFEAMIAQKRVYIYANDIKEYNDERGLYFRFEELPFKLFSCNEEIINYIKNNDYDKNFTKEYLDFFNKVGLKEQGCACESIVKYIMERMSFYEKRNK